MDNGVTQRDTDAQEADTTTSHVLESAARTHMVVYVGGDRDASRYLYKDVHGWYVWTDDGAAERVYLEVVDGIIQGVTL